MISRKAQSFLENLNIRSGFPRAKPMDGLKVPKGELGFYLVSDGKPHPWRYHVRAPSFINLTALSKMCEGNKVADAIIILGSIDIVLGETDR